jgi:adenylate cyclase
VKRCDIKTVLIIEDDADIRKFASRMLELEGYHVIQAADADEGLRLARKRRVALVLLDLKLPGRDGWAVLAELKSEPALSAIPVVVFTASAGAPQRDRALGMGAADYLVKPLSAARLKQSVAHILHRKG